MTKRLTERESFIKWYLSGPGYCFKAGESLEEYVWRAWKAAARAARFATRSKRVKRLFCEVCER
jgi:hypothetical protein